jgi:hypothetical protein
LTAKLIGDALTLQYDLARTNVYLAEVSQVASNLDRGGWQVREEATRRIAM